VTEKEELPPQRTLEFRLYPTRAQEQQLEAWLELQRRIWNYGIELLQEREAFAPWSRVLERDGKTVLFAGRHDACPIPWEDRWKKADGDDSKWTNRPFSKIARSERAAKKKQFFCSNPLDHHKPELDCSRRDDNPEYSLKAFFAKKNHPDWAELQGCPINLIRGTLKALATAWKESRPGKRDSLGRQRKPPRFKGVHYPITTLNDTDCKATVKVTSNTVKLPGLGPARIRGNHNGRRWPSDRVVTTYRIMREPSGWHLLLVGVVPLPRVRNTDLKVGLDFGVTHTLTTSAGKQINSPKALAANLRRLERLQQKLARQKPGSANRKKTKARIARLHEKIRRTRKLFAHKVSTRLLRTYQSVVLEDLKIQNMNRRPAPKPSEDGKGFEPNQAAAKAGLNRQISDHAWGQLRTLLEEKGKALGRKVYRVDPKNTSRQCPSCGHTSAKNRPSQAVFLCEACGHSMNADHNAAINILRSQFADEPVPMAPAPLQQDQAQLVLLTPATKPRRRPRQPGPGGNRANRAARNQKTESQLDLF